MLLFFRSVQGGYVRKEIEKHKSKERSNWNEQWIGRVRGQWGNCRDTVMMLSISINSGLSDGCSCSCQLCSLQLIPAAPPTPLCSWGCRRWCPGSFERGEGSPWCVCSLQGAHKEQFEGSAECTTSILAVWKISKSIFFRFLFTQQKDVGIYIGADLTNHNWESLPRNRAF